MNIKNLLIAVFILAAVPGCSTLNGIGEYAAKNPLIVDAATRQAVFRYIDAGESEADTQKRAADVIGVARNIDRYLEGSPVATPSAVLSVVEQNIKWDKLSLADRALAKDILTLIELNLQSKQREGYLSSDALVGIRALLNVAISTASLL